MPRSPQLETRTARFKLEPRRKPYWIAVAPGISLGYRAGPGSWSVRGSDGKGGNWIKSFGRADDHEEANGATILTYWQAIDRARELACGPDTTDSTAAPTTLAGAIDDYEADLKARGGKKVNATNLRYHLTVSALMAKPISMLTTRDLRRFRDDMTNKTVNGRPMRRASINRLGTSLKACLNLAARLDPRIANAKAWTDALSRLEETDSEDANVVLTDDERAAIVAAAYDVSFRFGLFVEAHAVGARSSQLAALNVADFEHGTAARILVKASRKGGRGKVRKVEPMPISTGFAQRLAQECAGRGGHEPLLRDDAGERWRPTWQTFKTFAKIATALDLGKHRPKLPTLYAFRHTAITRMLLAGVPTHLVAQQFDTSDVMIRRTYAKFISHHGDELLRRAIFDADAVQHGGNVVPLAGRR